MRLGEMAMKERGSMYYVLAEEWLSSDGSGYDVIGEFRTMGEAMAKADELCSREMGIFGAVCGRESTAPEWFALDGGVEGVAIRDKKGLEKWWYAAKVVPVSWGLEG